MLKDITLGQFIPGDSFVHRLDPRMKIILSIVFAVALFSATRFRQYAVCALFVLVSAMFARTPVRMLFKGIGPIWFILLITGVINAFFTDGTPIFRLGAIALTYEGIFIAAKMILRIMLLVSETSLLTFTTSPILLTDAVESLLLPLKLVRFPVHDFAMMMSIALRFIPTLIEEVGKITDAQKARGADFESGNIFQRVRAYTPILVPLFVSSFRRADELATAMECRLYNGGKGRTRLRELKFRKNDYLSLIISLAFVGIIYYLKGGVPSF